MKTLLVIVGPTASGKTTMAIQAAQMLGTEILSCDSRQFYRELAIGVARPTDEELASAPHHFIAHRSVEQPYNVFQYEQEALALLDRLFLHHDTLVAVGGSGLYVDALCQGIALLPDPAPELREKLSRQIQEEGIEPLQRQLQALDPSYYATIDQQNPMRLQRALETILTAGRPLSEILQQEKRPRSFTIVKIGIDTDRAELRQRIDQRVDLMIEQGLLDEVRRLTHLRHLNTLNTVGYKELFAYLDGDSSLADAIAAIKTHTWQYAKKQITWLKRYPEIRWLSRDGLTPALLEALL